MKKHLRHPKWRLVLYIIAGICIILLLANTIIGAMLTNKARQAFKQFPSSLQASFSSIHANLFNASLDVTAVNIRYTPYTTQPQNTHAVYFQSISLKGINFFKMIFNNKLSASTLMIDGGTIKLDSFLIEKKDSAQTITLPQIPLGSLTIGSLKISETNVWLLNGKEEHLLLKGDIAFNELKIIDVNKPISRTNFQFENIEAALSNIQYTIPNAAHSVQVKSITVNTEGEILQIDSLHIIPKFNKAEHDTVTKQQDTRINATIAGITLLKVDFVKLFDKKFTADKIIITNPEVSFYDKHIQQLSTTPLLVKTLFDISVNSLTILNPVLHVEVYGKQNVSKKGSAPSMRLPFMHAAIKHLAITNTKISTQYNSVNKLSAKGDINIDDISVDSANKHLSTIACNIEDIDCTTQGSYNKLQIEKLLVNSTKSTLQVDGIKIIPLYGKLELGRMLGHQADYIDATIASIQLVKPDILKMLDKKLVADKIIINEIKAYVFRDRRLTRPQQTQLLPMASLKNMPIDIKVNSLQVSRSSVAYEEFPKDGVQTGTLKVAKMNVSVTPFVNRSSLTNASRLAMHVDGAIMGSGSVDADISMPFNANEDYTVQGAINNLDLTTLNSSAENLGKFHIESGMLNKLDFQFNFNEIKSTGQIVGVYHNIVVDKLKGNDKKIAKIPTFVVKHIIIPKNKDESLAVNRRTGKIDYIRDPTRFPSFYLLQSLLTGIRSSFTFGFLLPK